MLNVLYWLKCLLIVYVGTTVAQSYYGGIGNMIVSHFDVLNGMFSSYVKMQKYYMALVLKITGLLLHINIMLYAKLFQYINRQE